MDLAYLVPAAIIITITIELFANINILFKKEEIKKSDNTIILESNRLKLNFVIFAINTLLGIIIYYLFYNLNLYKSYLLINILIPLLLNLCYLIIFARDLKLDVNEKKVRLSIRSLISRYDKIYEASSIERIDANSAVNFRTVVFSQMFLILKGGKSIKLGFIYNSYNLAMELSNILKVPFKDLNVGYITYDPVHPVPEFTKEESKKLIKAGLLPLSLIGFFAFIIITLGIILIIISFLAR